MLKGLLKIAMNRTMYLLLVTTSVTATSAAAPGKAQLPKVSDTENIHHSETSSPLHLSLRTNALYDLALVPDFGIEIQIGSRYSIGANGAYAWWSKSEEMKFWRIAGGELYFRRYFGNSDSRTLSGHHAGIYGQMFTYEIATGKRHSGQQSDLSFGAGIEYGYTLSLTRHLNLDFTLGIGYIGGEYKRYISQDTHRVWQSTSRRNWTGPSKAEVSIVWLLGEGNTNARKGGER